MSIEINQPSTHRGIILATGAIVTLLFEWFGHSSSEVMPLFVGLAGAHGLFVNDNK